MEKKHKTNKPIDSEARNINVTIRFSEKEIAEFEKIAKEINIPRTRFIRNLALSGLDEAKVLNKIGALKGAKKLLDFKERLKNYSNYQELQFS